MQLNRRSGNEICERRGWLSSHAFRTTLPTMPIRPPLPGSAVGVAKASSLVFDPLRIFAQVMASLRAQVRRRPASCKSNLIRDDIMETTDR
jgi:hypothetical protein